jgi:hypothetical protein
MATVDDHFARREDALVAAACGFGATALARVAAIVGSVSLELGVLLMVLAVGCLITALAYLVLALGFRQALQSDWGMVGHWEREHGMATPVESTAAPAEPEPCHCTNCLNRRSW